MATTNPFDLLGEFDNDDPSQIIAAQPLKTAPTEKKAPAAATKTAKLPSKPVPPAQAVKEARNDNPRGGARGGGRGFGRERGYNRDLANNENSFSNNNGFSDRYKPTEGGESGKPPERRNYGSMQGGFRGGRRGGFNNGDAADGEHPRRPYERHSGTGRGNEIKRDGAGRGNWGTPKDDIAPETEEPTNENEEIVEADKEVVDEVTGDANKDGLVAETKEKEPENKEMTLEEYEKVLEEKRKALLALKAEERKVVVDEEFAKMQLLSNKKSNDEIFVKLGSDKDKGKEAAEREEKAKKQPKSINEFLKPAERSGGVGGRRGGRGGPREGFSGRNMVNNVASAPSIDDVAQFPTLCAK